MFVVVVAVRGVPVSIVDVVDMATMRHSDMSAALAMRVLVTIVRDVLTRLALVVVVVVGAVQVPVVGVVDMIAVRYSDMSAALTVRVVVTGVLLVRRSHQTSSMRK